MLIKKDGEVVDKVVGYHKEHLEEILENIYKIVSLPERLIYQGFPWYVRRFFILLKIFSKRC